MAAASDVSPQSAYIQHHLVHLNNLGEKQSVIAQFDVINYDSVFWSALTGLAVILVLWLAARRATAGVPGRFQIDRKSTRLNSSHVKISYAVFCLKKKNHK